MVGGRPVAILQFQPFDDVVAGKLVHRRLFEVTGKNQITPLRIDRRQRSGFQPHERNTGCGDAIAGFDETRDLRRDAGTHGPHAIDHFLKAAGEIGVWPPCRRLAVLIGHADLVILVDDHGSIEKIVIDRHLAVIARHPVKTIRGVDIFSGIIPGGVVIQRCAELFAKGDESTRRRLARTGIVEQIRLFPDLAEGGQDQRGDDEKHQREGGQYNAHGGSAPDRQIVPNVARRNPHKIPFESIIFRRKHSEAVKPHRGPAPKKHGYKTTVRQRL